MSVPKLQIHTSNRLDVLLEHLLDRLDAPKLPPFEREFIVVQSQGMFRWLSLRLAEHHGISMAIEALSPTNCLRGLADLLLDEPESLEGGPKALTQTFGQPSAKRDSNHDVTLWGLFDELNPAHLLQLNAPQLATYLSEDPEQHKRFQLAWRLSQLFEDYQLYRPDMLAQWRQQLPDAIEAGPERWQAQLWRQLEQRLDDTLARRLQHLEAALAAPEMSLELLQQRGAPSRLSIFGASTLPPLFLRLMLRLSTFIPVDIYVSSPTYHYWGDLRSERETLRLSKSLPGGGQHLEESHYETGNRLLAGLGRQGRDFFNLLQEIDPGGDAWHELDFDLKPPTTVLETLTHDILHLVDRGSDPDSVALPLPSDDLSLSVHVCHSPLREMEVLRDQILSLFAKPDAERLRPDDILVMVPDIDLYSPYIEGVFGVEHRDGLRLPFSIADRRATQELPAAAAVLRLLALVTDRLTPAEVFDFLETDAVSQRFGLQPGDLPLLRQWVDDLNIRWAIDGDRRRELFDVPPTEGNTWSSGLQRLLAGYALGPLDQVVEDTAPWADQGPGEVELLGNLVAFLDALFEQLRPLSAPRRLSAWAADLSHSLEQLFDPRSAEDLRALEKVRQLLEDLREIESASNCLEEVERAAFEDYLQARLAASGGGTQFLTGRINFCALKPMRTLPFKVICIAGLDDGSFPRPTSPRSFDLIYKNPRLGDRSLREDDRYLFLETLLAARQRLMLSYVGFSQKDGAPRPPSVVVSELLEQVDRTFVVEGEAASRRLIQHHRLHPFHPSYFEDGAPQSFSLENLEASRALLEPQVAVQPFVPLDEVGGTSSDRSQDLLDEVGGTSSQASQDLPVEVGGTSSQASRDLPDEVGGTSSNPQETEFLDLSIDDLIRFWVHPSRDYCRQVLGLTLWQDSTMDDGAEPFEVTGLSAYHLHQEMVRRRQETPDVAVHSPSNVASEYHLMRARGDLPVAELGQAAYAKLRRTTEAFVGRLPDFEAIDPPHITLEGTGWHLSGQLHGLTRGGFLQYRLARLKAKDQVRAWIQHLVWNAARGQATEPYRFIPLDTHLIGLDQQFRLAPVVDPLSRLDELIVGLRRGRLRPLPVFEKASHAFAKQQLEILSSHQSVRRSAMEAALVGWRGQDRPGSSFTGGDRDDPWVALCFRAREPLSEPEFAPWARLLWRPLLAALEEI